jgi:DNA-binding LacI/PurR family transcriptional regulator
MGFQAVTMLINRLRDPSLPVEQHLLPPELIVRETTAPPPA